LTINGIRKFFKILKKQIPVFIFFIIFFTVLTTLSYLDNITDCFPVTVITVEENIINSMVNKEGVCESNVFSEKMTFDSSIFNHYETPPVKDIFFLSIKLPYSEWQLIKETENATVEANPFVESLVKTYHGARLKWLVLSFILIFVAGLTLFAASMPSKRESDQLFKGNTFVTFLIILISVVSLFFHFRAGIIAFASLTLFSVITIYLMFLLLYSKFVLEKKRTKKEILQK